MLKLEIERRISVDSVISIDQVEYEVDYRFDRQRIRLCYSPDMKQIFVVEADGCLTCFPPGASGCLPAVPAEGKQLLSAVGLYS